MANAIIYLDPDSEHNLQAQIRLKLVDAILLGTFPEGQRLPSSRKLADQLGVARNTVKRYLRTAVPAGVQVRPQARCLSEEARAEARRLYEGVAEGNAVVAHRLLLWDCSAS